LDALASLLSNALTPDLYCLTDFPVLKRKKTPNKIMKWRIAGVDKGQFVTPMMSWESSNDLNRFIVDAFRQGLAGYVWAELFQREREVVEIDSSIYPDGYWEVVLGRAEAQATILVPYDPVGDTITKWTYGPGVRAA
jgi:hypothetical protein